MPDKEKEPWICEICGQTMTRFKHQGPGIADFWKCEPCESAAPAQPVPPSDDDPVEAMERLIGLDPPRKNPAAPSPVQPSAEPKCAKKDCGQSYGAPCHNQNNWLYHAFEAERPVLPVPPDDDPEFALMLDDFVRGCIHPSLAKPAATRTNILGYVRALHRQARLVWDSSPAVDDLLLNLLAVIHRDGGHYVTEHGLEKAAKDAEKIAANYNATPAVAGRTQGDLNKLAQECAEELRSDKTAFFGPVILKYLKRAALRESARTNDHDPTTKAERSAAAPDWNEKEMQALAALAKKLDISEMGVLRQSLRTFQLIQCGMYEIREVNPQPKMAVAPRVEVDPKK